MANNLTRINNNQISSASAGNVYLGINASTKVQEYTITSGLLANNLTYGSDLTVTGNLTVQGTTTAVNTINTLISDPLIVLADGQTSGAPTVDIGYIGLRGSQDNIAVAWKEADNEVVAAFTTTESGNVYSNTTFTIASYANFHANTITANSNLNVNGTTSLVGNIISNVTVNGDVTSDNFYTAGQVSATGNITAGASSFFIGNGSQLTDVTASSVNANALTGNTLAAGVVNSSLTSVGDLTNLSVVGTTTSGNLATGGTVSATGDITGANFSTTGNITGANNIVGTTISGTSNVIGGNVSTGGFVSATGNVTGGNFFTGGAVSATGNITAGASSFFIGNGSQLTGVTASSANAETLTGVFLANNVLASSLTSVGDLTNLSVVGTTTSGNLATGGTVSATGTVTAGNVDTGGTVSATGTVTAGNVATGGTVSATANITGGNVLTGGIVSATSTITGGNLDTGGTVSATSTITGGNLDTGGTVSATSTITGGNIATGGTASVTGNATVGNLLTNGQVSAQGNVTGGNVITDYIFSTDTANATLTINAATISLNPVGNVGLNSRWINNLANPQAPQDAATKQYVDDVAQGLNIHDSTSAATPGTLATITGGVTTYNNGPTNNGVGATITTTGSYTNIDGVAINTANTRILVLAESNAVHNGVYVYSNATAITRAADYNQVPEVEAGDFVFNLYGNVYGNTGWVQTSNVSNVGQAGNSIVFTQFSGAGTYLAGNALTLNGTVFNVNVDTSSANTIAINGSNELYIPAGATLTTPNIGAATGTSLSVTGDVTGGNLYTGGAVSAAGTATVGNLATAGTVSATANITGGNIDTGGIISATSTITGGNLATGGTVSATSTITGGNLATGGTVSATGDATVGNLATGGTVSATANITGGNVLTGGIVSATSTITGGNLATGGTVSATANITGGNIDTGGIISATSTITGGNLATAGTVSATSNITGGNVLTGGIVSATGTVTGGNLDTGGTVSATGNATVGNLITGGTVSATANVTGGNITTAGDVSATGNVYAANFIGNISGNISSPGANTDVIFNDNNVANATSGFTFNKTSNTVTVGANVDAVSFNGNVYSTTVSATANITGGNIATGGTVSATSNITGGNVLTSGVVSATTSVTGGNIVISGDDITDTNGRVNFNTAGADVDFAVNGDTVANIFYIDAGTGTASFGSATQTINSIVAFNATNSILMPVGNTSQRPAGVTGQFRFNTTVNSLEIYDNSAWTSVGQPDFTLITDQQFTGTGSQTVYTLSGNATTAGSIVSINGVQQIPVTAYAVSGTTLTFTEAPEVGDLIDVRVLTTTTTIYGLSNSEGTAQVNVVDGSPVVAVTGDLSVSGSILGGNINSTAITFGTSNMSVVSSGGNIRANVAGTTVQTISPGLVAITGDLSVSGNATLSGNILGDRLQNGTTSFDIQTPNGNANITIGGTSNTAVFSSSALTLATNLLPSANITYNLGSTTQRWNDLWLANSTIYIGNAQISANATSLIFTSPQGGQTVFAGATGGNLTVSNIINSNANGVGNIGSDTTYFNTVFAKATSAQYADLAEKYVADAEYAPGTVVVFGGTHEVTANATDADRKVAGVVSTNPSYIMNGGLTADHVATVALTGRVPTLVVGAVRKGDLMVAAGLGRARSEADPKVGTVIGKALEDFDGAEGTIEVVVGRF